MTERPVDVLDPDLEPGLVERNPAGEGFANELVADRHAGDQRFAAVVVGPAAAHPQRLAEGNEFRIALDVGDEIEHLRGPVANPALVVKGGQGSRTSGALRAA